MGDESLEPLAPLGNVRPTPVAAQKRVVLRGVEERLEPFAGGEPDHVEPRLIVPGRPVEALDDPRACEGRPQGAARLPPKAATCPIQQVDQRPAQRAGPATVYSDRVGQGRTASEDDGLVGCSAVERVIVS